MCQECSVLQSAHRYQIQMYLHLTARKNRQALVPEPVTRELDACLSEAASRINEAWMRLVEHQARHPRNANLGQRMVSALSGPDLVKNPGCEIP
jgi:hypothetical protein